jgi:RNA polymerase sigma-70 factor (ECF subfamily)
MQYDAAPAGRAVGDAEPPPVRPSAAADTSWIEVVYEDHARELWAVFYAQCCDPDLARDALLEAFLRLHSQDRRSLRDVKAWLVRVGRNWLRDVARRRRHAARPSDLLDAIAGKSHDPLARMASDETQSRIRHCLSLLKDDDRQALVLRYALDWPSNRMAEVLEISPAAVDMRLSRARKRFAELLHAYEHRTADAIKAR